MLESRLGAAAALLNIDLGGKGGDIRLAIPRVALGWRENIALLQLCSLQGGAP